MVLMSGMALVPFRRDLNVFLLCLAGNMNFGVEVKD